MFAVIDSETTGLSTQKDRIVEIAIIGLTDEGHQEWEWSTLVNPNSEIGASHIHGITTSDTTRASEFERYSGHIVRLLGGRIIVGHNVEFDVNFLRAEFERIGIATPRLATICTAELARAAGYRPFTLSACCRRFGIARGREHWALDDALATAQMLPFLVDLNRHGNAPEPTTYLSGACPWPYVEVDLTIGTVRE